MLLSFMCLALALKKRITGDAREESTFSQIASNPKENKRLRHLAKTIRRKLEKEACKRRREAPFERCLLVRSFRKLAYILLSHTHLACIVMETMLLVRGSAAAEAHSTRFAKLWQELLHLKFSRLVSRVGNLSSTTASYREKFLGECCTFPRFLLAEWLNTVTTWAAPVVALCLCIHLLVVGKETGEPLAFMGVMLVFANVHCNDMLNCRILSFALVLCLSGALEVHQRLELLTCAIVWPIFGKRRASLEQQRENVSDVPWIAKVKKNHDSCTSDSLSESGENDIVTAECGRVISHTLRKHEAVQILLETNGIKHYTRDKINEVLPEDFVQNFPDDFDVDRYIELVFLALVRYRNAQQKKQGCRERQKYYG